MPLEEQAKKRRGFAWRVTWLLVRGLCLIFILLFLSAGAGLFMLSRLLDAGKVKDRLTSQIEALLGRSVSIEGVVLTPHGIKLHKIIVMEKGQPDRPMISSDIALVSVKLLPLLRRRLELKNVKLVAPRIWIFRDEDGHWNFSDIIASTSAPRGLSKGRFFIPGGLAADETVIERGLLQIEDRLKNTSHVIERFNLSVAGFDMDRPFAISASFDHVSRFAARQITTSFSLDGSMFLASGRWGEAYLNADRLQLKVDGHRFSGSGWVRGFSEPMVEADVSVPPLAASDWEKHMGRTVDFSMPASRWQVKARLKGSRASIEDMALSAAPLSLKGRGYVDWSGPKPRADAEFFLQSFPLEAASAWRRSLEGCDLKGSLQGQAALSWNQDQLEVHGLKLKLGQAQARFKHVAVSQVQADLDAGEGFSSAALSIRGRSLQAFSNAFSNIALGLRLVNRDLKVDDLSFVWEGSRVKLKSRVLDISDPKEISVAGSMENLQWEKAQELVSGILASLSTSTAAGASEPATAPPRRTWVKIFKYAIPRKFPDSVGHLRVGNITHKNFSFASTDLLWDIRGVTPSLKKVNGDLRLGFGPGRVNDVQALQGAHKILAIVFLPYIYMHKMNNLSVLSAGTAYPKTLDFNRIESRYGIREGVVTTHFCYVDSPQVIAYADGTADFPREKVDMNILTRLTSYRAPLPEWWVDELGRPAIGFRVKGDLNHPDLEPRLNKMAANEIEKALEEGRRRAKERFKVLEKLYNNGVREE
ncbi:MAG: AsmA family protein [Elusimicrobia bacterium]|nr:AsmA family protein [Elusimicrobiota bacterium]